jgi:hypothetical protein
LRSERDREGLTRAGRHFSSAAPLRRAAQSRQDGQAAPPPAPDGAADAAGGARARARPVARGATASAKPNDVPTPGATRQPRRPRVACAARDGQPRCGVVPPLAPRATLFCALFQHHARNCRSVLCAN